MKLDLPILLTTLSLVFLSYDASAGTSMQSLSNTTKYKDMGQWLKDKEAAEEFARKEKNKSSSSIFVSNSLHRWHLHELYKHIESDVERLKQMMILAEIQKGYEAKAEFVEMVFPLATLDSFNSKKTGYLDDAKKYHLEIFDREVGSFKDDYDMIDLREAIVSGDAKKIKQIVNIVRASEIASIKAINKDDVEQINKLAAEKKYPEARAIIEKAIKVYASSSISEQLDSIRQRVAKNEDADMDINRLIADLIFLEVNEKQEHTQLIMELQRMKTKPVGASVFTGSEIIK